MREFTVEMLNEKGSRIQVLFVDDMKTLRGVVNRMQRLNNNPLVESIKISWLDTKDNVHSYIEKAEKKERE